MYNGRATWGPSPFCFSLQLFDVTAAHSLPLGIADPLVNLIQNFTGVLKSHFLFLAFSFLRRI